MEAARLSGGEGEPFASGRFGAERRRDAEDGPLPFESFELEADEVLLPFVPFAPNDDLPPPCPLPPALFRFLDELDLADDESAI